MTGAEHVAWAKERALEYVDLGQPAQAMASLTSDLAKHPDTQDHAAIGLMYMLALAGHLSTPGDVREFIEGVN